MATEKEILAARIFLRAVLPVIKVVLEDDPVMKKKFKDVRAKVQFSAGRDKNQTGAYLVFDKGQFRVEQGTCDDPDIIFVFKNIAGMNAFFAGKPVLPGIKGILKVGLLLKVFSLLMSLKILMPNARPK
ncbi:MAG: hypothetical protein R6V76_05825, partial [Desulfobacterales bacterium]